MLPTNQGNLREGLGNKPCECGSSAEDIGPRCRPKPLRGLPRSRWESRIIQCRGAAPYAEEEWVTR